MSQSKELSAGEIWDKAKAKAFRGGLSGAASMVLQVSSLMWLRTTMNVQYRHGGTFTGTLRSLYADGGVRRFYRGYAPALAQGPLSRFGDTAANEGVKAVMEGSASTRDLPIGVKTLFASAGSAGFRVFLMPIDTVKTTLQVEGKEGIALLRNKAKARGPGVFFYGAVGAMSATFVGHYPWFVTFNTLDSNLPHYPDSILRTLGRNASIGFCSSVVSDCCSNSIRVLKTYRQTHSEQVSYQAAAKQIIAKDGIVGLFGRGLQTRIIANGCQGMMFTIVFKYFQSLWGDSK